MLLRPISRKAVKEIFKAEMVNGCNYDTILAKLKTFEVDDNMLIKLRKQVKKLTGIPTITNYNLNKHDSNGQCTTAWWTHTKHYHTTSEGKKLYGEKVVESRALEIQLRPLGRNNRDNELRVMFHELAHGSIMKGEIILSRADEEVVADLTSVLLMLNNRALTDNMVKECGEYIGLWWNQSNSVFSFGYLIRVAVNRAKLITKRLNENYVAVNMVKTLMKKDGIKKGTI